MKNKNIIVFGLGKTGFIVIKTLTKLNLKIFIWDSSAKKMVYTKYLFMRIGTKIHFITKYILDFYFMLISPGIPCFYPKQHKIYVLCKKYKICLKTDMDFIYSFTMNLYSVYVGITGTNGKSTMCCYIYNLMKQKVYQTLLAGNIGLPILNSSFTNNISTVYNK